MKRRDEAKDAYAFQCGWDVIRLKEAEIVNRSAMNIAKRFSDYMLENGASLATPANFPRVK